MDTETNKQGAGPAHSSPNTFCQAFVDFALIQSEAYCDWSGLRPPLLNTTSLTVPLASLSVYILKHGAAFVPLDPPWTPPGPPLDPPLDHPWTTPGPPPGPPLDPPLDHPWTPPGPPLDHPWTPPGPPRLSHRYVDRGQQRWGRTEVDPYLMSACRTSEAPPPAFQLSVGDSSPLLRRQNLPQRNRKLGSGCFGVCQALTIQPDRDVTDTLVVPLDDGNPVTGTETLSCRRHHGSLNPPLSPEIVSMAMVSAVTEEECRAVVITITWVIDYGSDRTPDPPRASTPGGGGGACGCVRTSVAMAPGCITGTGGADEVAPRRRAAEERETVVNLLEACEAFLRNSEEKRTRQSRGAEERSRGEERSAGDGRGGRRSDSFPAPCGELREHCQHH
ncbi:unnamed protein product [Arctogadus glacialis]